MSLFYAKKLAENEPRLGAKFKQSREAFGIDIPSASKTTRIPAEYLEALERNHFSDLPKAKVYRYNYVREYARFLHLDETAALNQFNEENGLKGIGIIHPKQTIKNVPLFSISMFARNLLIAGLILLFAGYLAWQVKQILNPPKLTVYSPAEGITISEKQVAVQGETEKETKLAINGQEIMPDEKGRFNLVIDLADGLNTIVITATKKHGKVSTVTRHIVVKNF